ncbi:MAG: hypothetical protein HQK51_03225 [Oligoflexia bacterium]|nr:hypothetical protein [Oligoflexia bacterium]
MQLKNELKNKFKKLIIGSWLFLTVFVAVVDTEAASKIPILLTKQPSNKICFISKDGKYTYYQKRPTTLVLSSMYKLIDVLTGPPEATFNLFATPARKKIAIEMMPFQYHNISSTSLNYLYVMDFGESVATPIEKGIHPTLHLDDKWISYYHPLKKAIFFQNIESLNNKKNTGEQAFKIQLKNPLNPYFIPEVVMYTEDLVLFTDINLEGVSALLLLNRSKQKLITLIKSKKAGTKIELCLNKTKLFVGQFPYPDVLGQSEIAMIDLDQTKDFSKMEMLYISDHADVGNIECQSEKDLLFFIQNQSDKEDLVLTKSELVAIDLKKKQVITISDLIHTTQVINMDGRLLIPYRGDFYVIKGDSNLNTDKLINIKIKHKNKETAKNYKLGISNIDQTVDTDMATDLAEVQTEDDGNLSSDTNILNNSNTTTPIATPISTLPKNKSSAVINPSLPATEKGNGK